MGERLYRTTGVIIKRLDVGEADRVLTILTPLGKINANARGIRKTASRLAGHLELLSYCQLQLAAGKNRDVVTQSVAIARFDELQQRLYTMAAGYYVAELSDHFVTEEASASSALTHLLACLQMLCQPCYVEMVMHWYTLQLSDIAGYRPQLFECAVCAAVLDEQAQRWSITQGGMLCPDCVRADIHATTISLAVFKLLRFVQREPLAVVSQTLQPFALHTQVFLLLRQWVTRHSEQPLRSAQFFDDVRRKEYQDYASESA
ncbi:MAG: DNA repair protein RecO [Chloroflexia bacterium]|nr:DNA repair protein RecO [Chloroflexia bacterium]